MEKDIFIEKEAKNKKQDSILFMKLAIEKELSTEPQSKVIQTRDIVW